METTSSLAWAHGAAVESPPKTMEGMAPIREQTHIGRAAASPYFAGRASSQGRWTPLPRSSCRAAVARSSALPGRVGVCAAVIAPIARDVLGARGRAWRRGRRGRPRRGGEHRGARASHPAEPQRQEWCRLDATAMELTAPCS